MKTQTAIDYRPNLLAQVQLDRARLQSVGATHERVGRWLNGHPGAARVLGRFATKHLRAFEENRALVEPTVLESRSTRPPTDLDSFRVAHANHIAAGVPRVNIDALPQPNAVAVEAQLMPTIEPARVLTKV